MMSPEERKELMEFILQSQSNAAKEMAEMRDQMEKLTGRIDTLASVSHDLVEVARLHSSRLDGRDGR